MMEWIRDRVPTREESEEAGDTGFIVCISGRIGGEIYEHAIIMDGCFYYMDAWDICGVRRPNVTVHGWMIPPSWVEPDE